MRDSLAWWGSLPETTLTHAIEEQRAETLAFLARLAIAGYPVWHLTMLLLQSGFEVVQERTIRAWALALIVVCGPLLTLWLQRRGVRWAPAWFLASTLASATAAAWLLETPEALIVFPLITLTAVVLLHPLAGALTGLAATGLLATLWAAGPLAFISPDRLTATSVACGLTVAVAWALGRTLVTTAEAASASHAEAWRHAQEARANRAELVQALKQLDQAYYRLQRANAALELAWKAADDAERAKTEFVTNISHELRTPLNLIIGFSEMILTSPETYRAPLPPVYRGDLNAVYRSAQHLLTLTNDVIDLARVGMDRLALIREPGDLGEVIGDAAGIVRAYIETKGLALHLRVEPGLPVFLFDRLRVRQVLLNLLTNAARFTERGSITVAAGREGGWARVSVADTGRGIADAERPRVFEEFYHDGGAGTRPAEGFGGIGLGLPLSKRFVELHGGDIGVESAPGAGSTFWFRLPITSVAPPAGWSPVPRRAAPHGDAERVVVLAHPDGQVLDLLRRHLAGYRIVPAPTLAAAIEVATETSAFAILADGAPPPPDLVLPAPVLGLPLPREPHLAMGEVVARLVKPVTRADLYEALRRVPGPLLDVLIVDDDPRFLRLLERMLETTPWRPGYRVRAAQDGRAALALLAERRPDLILLDLTMPELDGAGLLAAMRADPALRSIPVIVISAHDRMAATFPLEGRLLLTKPDGLSLDEMLRALAGLLGALTPPRHTLNRSAAAAPPTGPGSSP
jgi:signal transduction histidine kinase/CheY-like chemotaxis protein